MPMTSAVGNCCHGTVSGLPVRFYRGFCRTPLAVPVSFRGGQKQKKGVGKAIYESACECTGQLLLAGTASTRGGRKMHRFYVLEGY